MASSTYNRIMIRSGDDPTRVETTAGEAGIGPGDLLEWSSGEFLRHNTAGGPVIPVLVAIESVTTESDSDTSLAINTDYDDGDTVYAWIPKSGDHVYMWLAAGENASQHSLLESDGDGALQVEAAVDQTDIVRALVGRAVAAVDNSLGATPARVVVEIT